MITLVQVSNVSVRAEWMPVVGRGLNRVTGSRARRRPWVHEEHVPRDR